MSVIPQMWNPLYLSEQSQGYSFSTISVPPTTLELVPFSPQYSKSSRKSRGAGGSVVVVVVVAESTTTPPPETTPGAAVVVVVVVVVVVLLGKSVGQMRAPMVPMAIPTGKATTSSCRSNGDFNAVTPASDTEGEQLMVDF